MRREIQESVKAEYPYAYASPSAPASARRSRIFRTGFRAWRIFFFGSCGGIVNYFTKSHYTEGEPSLISAIGSYLSEDLLVRGLAQWLRSSPVWGAGLLFLSRYPIVSAAFHPHETRRLGDAGGEGRDRSEGEGRKRGSSGPTRSGTTRKA
jgi:hypothetical protein